MSDVLDDIVDRRGSHPPTRRVSPPSSSRRMANTLNTKPELLLEFCGHLAKPGDETVSLYADGKPVEIPIF